MSAWKSKAWASFLFLLREFLSLFFLSLLLLIFEMSPAHIFPLFPTMITAPSPVCCLIIQRFKGHMWHSWLRYDIYNKRLIQYLLRQPRRPRILSEVQEIVEFRWHPKKICLLRNIWALGWGYQSMLYKSWIKIIAKTYWWSITSGKELWKWAMLCAKVRLLLGNPFFQEILTVEHWPMHCNDFTALKIQLSKRISYSWANLVPTPF